MRRSRRIRVGAALVLNALFSLPQPTAAQDAPVPHALMPAPAELRWTEGRCSITAELRPAVRDAGDSRVLAALGRVLRRWEERTGLTFARSSAGFFAAAENADSATLSIECDAPGPAVPALGDDESYTLVVDQRRAVLRAATAVGALRGLETLSQLLQSDANGWFVPAVTINDRPRFPWRGLLIDVGRHWQPASVIKRNLDGMALVKLNVLHLHLSDDQGFRMESKTHPELHERGSDGLFYTQEEMREIIAYAAERAIRVLPEFDMPGHTTSWAVSHPELASAPGPYVLSRHWGVHDVVLDPTNEQTYALLEEFLGEMAALFPDAYFHIGGDENNHVQWNANPRIQAFIREHDLTDNAGLQTHFSQRVHAIMQRHGKRIVGWDEILHPKLPADSVVHSWRGQQGLIEAAQRGFATILSNGYYIDLWQAAAIHHGIDPVPANTPLTPEQQARVLGGEITMWGEWITPETIDSRIWPRSAAIAERLWSPRDVDDVPDMYRRLAYVNRRLEEAGLDHERNREAMIRRLAGDRVSDAERAQLRTFIDAIESVKEYQRNAQQPEVTQFTPLVGLVDCARPESDSAREFSMGVTTLLPTLVNEAALRSDPALAAGHDRATRPLGKVAALEAQARAWQAAGAEAARLLATHAIAGREGVPLATALAKASAIALEALDALHQKRPRDATWREAQLKALDQCAAPHGAAELPMLPAIRRLVEAAGR